MNPGLKIDQAQGEVSTLRNSFDDPVSIRRLQPELLLKVFTECLPKDQSQEPCSSTAPLLLGQICVRPWSYVMQPLKWYHMLPTTDNTLENTVHLIISYQVAYEDSGSIILRTQLSFFTILSFSKK